MGIFQSSPDPYDSTLPAVIKQREQVQDLLDAEVSFSAFLRPALVCVVLRFAVVDIDVDRDRLRSYVEADVFNYLTLKRAVEFSDVTSLWRETQERWNEPLWRSVALVNARWHLLPPAKKNFNIAWVRENLVKFGMPAIMERAEQAERERAAAYEDVKVWSTKDEHSDKWSRYFDTFAYGRKQLGPQNEAVVAAIDCGRKLDQGWMWHEIDISLVSRSFDNFGISRDQLAQLCRDTLEAGDESYGAWSFAARFICNRQAQALVCNGASKRFSEIDCYLESLRLNTDDDFSRGETWLGIFNEMESDGQVFVPHTGETLTRRDVAFNGVASGHLVCWMILKLYMVEGEEATINNRRWRKQGGELVRVEE